MHSDIDAEGLGAAIAAAPAIPTQQPSDTPAAKAARDREEAAASELDRETKEALGKIKRVYVAVHGIGDQFQYATIQQVANRLARYYNVAVPIPLGSFHSKAASEVGFLFLKTPPYDPRLIDAGLAEIYWADIPRAVQMEGYKLEESKKWALTLTGRIRLRAEGNQEQFGPALYETIEQVIDEIIQGVAILDRLFFLLGKVTTFKFQLKDLLDSFLGDVQIVTDFEAQRGKLLGRFNAAMEKIHKANDDVEIYFVAHSEGTVVALLGLLTAFHEYGNAGEDGRPKYRWVEQVRGLMTIGSPIEEHLILWPELFQPFEARTDPQTGTKRPAYRWQPGPDGPKIRWRNYCDKGDPIAYRLVETSDWLKRNEWDEVFEFDRHRHEFSFSRYPFPGKAAHRLLGRRGGLRPLHRRRRQAAARRRAGPRAEAAPERPARRPLQPRRALRGPGPAPVHGRLPALPRRADVPDRAAGGRYVRLYDAERAGLLVAVRRPDPGGADPPVDAVVVGLGRLPGHVPGRADRLHHARERRQPGISDEDPGPSLRSRSCKGKSRRRCRPIRCTRWASRASWASCRALVLIAQGAALLRPRLGAKTLIIPGALAVLLVAGSRVAGSMSAHMSDRGSLWGMLLGGAFFLYLWWLSVVFFDLIFVWHHYVRGSVRGATAVDRLRVMCAKPEVKR